MTAKKSALVFWFTGLSGSGKTTLANTVKPMLEKYGLSVLLVDGDEFRRSRVLPLGFSEGEIKLNNEEIARFCLKNIFSYDVILVPIISPYAVSRRKARELLGKGFCEVYCNASLDCVITRDTKGLYARAKRNEIQNLIGFSASNPYEAPVEPDLTLCTSRESPEQSAAVLCTFIRTRLEGRPETVS